MNIAVLLTCHNRKAKTIACLTSLFKADLPKDYTLEVFLVDDGSTDGTTLAVKENFPQVNIIQGTGKLFWNRGMHLAWKTAANTKNYDFYLWLNDDVIIKNNGISVLLENQNEYTESIICGVMASAVDKNITYGGRDNNSEMVLPDNSTPEICIYINGNMVLIPLKIYEKVGLLDEIYPHAIGDFDYGLRVIDKGFECRISSEIVGFCEANNSLPNWCIPEVKLIKRIKSLYSPLGNSHPYYFFIYEKRHFGFSKALKHFLTIHLRLLFPKLWLK
ncbi:glycosyltransferase family 2 protein [Lutibacter sp.]